MTGVKWSNDVAFPDGDNCQIGDTLVGLRGGSNYKFDFPGDGIKDENGNYLMGWSTVGASATNYLTFTNGVAGTPVKVELTGSDANINCDFVLKGTGVLDVIGLFTVNGSTSINAIIDDDTMATASDTNVPTAESVVAYVSATPGGAGGSNTQVQYNNSGALAGDTGLTTNGSGGLYTTSSYRAGVANTSTLVIGGTTYNSLYNAQSNSANIFCFSANRHSNTASVSSILALAKSRGTAASPAIVQSGDRIGEFVAVGYDGTDYAFGARIQFQTTGTIGANTIPTNINFLVAPDGGGAPARAMSIQEDKTVVFDGDIDASLTDGQLLIGNTGSVASKATLTAGAGISITNGSGSITVNATGGGYAWTEVTGTSQAMAINNGYIANNASLVTLTLPAASSVGDTVTVQGKGAGGWRIAQNAGQTIHFGASDTTTGVSGYLEFNNRYDSIELLCITANTEWAVLTGPQGTITVA